MDLAPTGVPQQTRRLTQSQWVLRWLTDVPEKRCHPPVYGGVANGVDQCRQYGSLSGSGEKLSYFEFELITNLKKSITFQDIKKEPRFINSLYVRRQMQATYFKISNSEYETFINLGNKINDN